jgi:hypothetical protein
VIVKDARSDAPCVHAYVEDITADVQPPIRKRLRRQLCLLINIGPGCEDKARGGCASHPRYEARQFGILGGKGALIEGDAAEEVVEEEDLLSGVVESRKAVVKAPNRN